MISSKTASIVCAHVRLPIFGAILLLAGCDRTGVDAPPPTMSADIDTVPPLATSTLDIPLTYDLAPVIAAMEKAVPTRFGNISKRLAVPERPRMHIAFEASRDPFRVSLDGQTAHITAVIHYVGRGWYDSRFAPEVSASCGIDNERPRAVIEIAVPLRITSDWKLRGRSRIERVSPVSADTRDMCRVTVFSIDVTSRVIDATRSLLEEKRSFIDGKISAVAIRPRFEEWWVLLQKPIQLTDNVWLKLNPTAVRMGKSLGTRRTLVTALGFSASPRVLTGNRPAEGNVPLPPLDSAAVGDGLHVLLEAILGYDVATRLLQDQLVGKTVERSGQKLVVKKARLFGIGGGKVALELRLTGSARAHIFFVGTPVYDPASRELFVPDLEYDVASANSLVSGFEWLKHDDVRTFFRTHARWAAGDIIATGRSHLQEGLNRDLAPGVRLTAEVTDVKGLAVHALRSGIALRAQADANAQLTIRQGK